MPLLHISISITVFLLLALSITAFHLIKLKRKYKDLRQTHRHLHSLITHIPDLIWLKDKQSRFLLVNKQFSRAFSLSEQQILGKTDFDICSDQTQAMAYYEDDLKTLREKQMVHTEELITGSDGCAAWSETIKVPIFDEHNQVVGTAGIARDISKRKKAERQMLYLAYHDDLTDLPNRISFTRQVSKALERPDGHVAVILLGLNHFKTINDSLGHACGDQVLIEISNRLKTLIDEQTIVARYSGDEFIISHQYYKQDNSLEKLQSLLLKLFESPVILEELNYNLSASFGIAVAPDDGGNCETLLKNADLAMYQSKINKHKHCVYFVQEFADQLLYKMKLGNQLHQAMKNQEFSLVYQPKMDSKTNSIVGLESLLRWKTTDQNWISPADFIPVAEQNGFIIELGGWIIKSVLKQIREWLDQGLQVPPVSINVSAVQLKQPHFIDYLFQQLLRYQIPGDLLEIELTEGVLMENIEETIELLNKMRSRNIRISIDDFGTGYSSLSYLPQLPIDTLKIDRAFITGLHLNTDNQKIVKTIVHLAANFNLSVIAEGVETKEELEETINCQINHIQGYYYSQPLTPTELEKKYLA
ncbi:putative bifunctional diguanylate cyclase/phosphodiesterase [Psychromonas ossibalaenae]|uniref:putative bifunctional diguanylate cyclase/phosphodiesterase n=1 Tax=Psychromonas ossibalaenae TaxID=444922 RepID=UPI000361E198|nr:GGDEF and EAL domain-containing protein [Psychromonas ossibalaenae]